MPNEMTPQEIAERLESISSDANSMQPEKCGYYNLVDVTLHIPKDIKALKQAASILRRVASGELKPVVHGRWIKKYNSGSQNYDSDENWYYTCSKCGGNLNCTTKFCPHCSALMGGKDGEP